MKSAALNNFFLKYEWLPLFFLTLGFFASPISVSVTTVSYLAAFLCVLFSNQWVKRWGRIWNNPVALSFWVLGALFVVGLFYTTETTHWALHDLQKRHWLLITPFLMVMVTEERWRRRMINAFLGAMIVTLMIAYPVTFFKIDLHRWFPMIRSPVMSGEFITGRLFMDYIAQSLAMSIAAFICGYRFCFENKWRSFYAILFCLMGFSVLFMSNSRTGYGIFLLLTTYLCVIRFGWRGFFLAIFTGILLIGLDFWSSSHFRFRIQQTVLHYQGYHQLQHETSVGQRMEMWEIAKKMIRHRPWFGYGTGGIGAAVQQVVPAKERQWNPNIHFVESIYLNSLLQFGLFGFTVLLGVLATQIKATFALPHCYRSLMQAVLIAILFGGLFNGFFESFTPAHIYSLFSIICFSALYRDQHFLE